jgi:hypothetical protein
MDDDTVIHGPEVSSKTLTIGFKPTLTIDPTFTLSPDSFNISFTTNISSWYSRLRSVEIKDLVTQKYIYVGKPDGSDQYTNNDIITVPYSKMSAPVAEQSYLINVYMTSAHGVDFELKAFTGTADYDGTHGTTVSDTWVEVSGYQYEVTVANAGVDSNIYLVLEKPNGDIFYKCPQLDTDTWLVMPPLGVEYQVYIINKTSDSVWASKMVNRSKINSVGGMHVWNYETNWTQLLLNSSGNHSSEREHETYLTNGSINEQVFFSGTNMGTFSASGVVVPEVHNDHSIFDDLYRLRDCSYATYRTPLGGWYRVAITRVNIDSNWTRASNVTVDMIEIPIEEV